MCTLITFELFYLKFVNEEQRGNSIKMCLCPKDYGGHCSPAQGKSANICNTLG